MSSVSPLVVAGCMTISTSKANGQLCTVPPPPAKSCLQYPQERSIWFVFNNALIPQIFMKPINNTLQTFQKTASWWTSLRITMTSRKAAPCQFGQQPSRWRKACLSMETQFGALLRHLVFHTSATTTHPQAAFELSWACQRQDPPRPATSPWPALVCDGSVQKEQGTFGWVLAICTCVVLSKG
jgi:hypothetical protein